MNSDSGNGCGERHGRKRPRRKPVPGRHVVNVTADTIAHAAMMTVLAANMPDEVEEMQHRAAVLLGIGIALDLMTYQPAFAARLHEHIRREAAIGMDMSPEEEERNAIESMEEIAGQYEVAYRLFAATIAGQ